MKNFSIFSLIAAVLLFSFTFKTTTENLGNDKEIKWHTLEEALKISKKEKKPIFIDVYTDWCGWCKRMDKATFSEASVIDYVNKNYIAVKLNAESNETLTFKGEKLNYRQISGQVFGVRGYPTIVLMDTKQESKAVPGYKDPEAFKSMLSDFK